MKIPTRFRGFQLGSLVIPYVNSNSKYHVILAVQSAVATKPSSLISFAVDMALDNGAGDMDTNSIRWIDTLVVPSLSVVQHADGKRNWLVGRRTQSDTLLAWLVDSVVHPIPVKTKINSPYLPFPSDRTAQVSKTSPNSEILFWNWGRRESRYNQLLKVNRETGKFSELIHLIDSASLNPNRFRYTFPVDASFSPDNRFLYTIDNYHLFNIDSTVPFNVQKSNKIFYTIRQYDLSNWDSAAIKNSGKVVSQSGPFPCCAAAGQLGPMSGQLGPDGKIYFQQFESNFLSVMHCPNSPAPKVNFKFREINLQRDGAFRPPTLNQTFVRNAGIFQLQANKRKLCQGDTLELSGYGAGAEKFRWSVSPAFPQNTKVDTLTWQKIDTRTIPPGAYTFRCQASSRCGDVFDKEIQVEVLPLPQKPNLLIQQKPVLCRGDSAIIRVQNPVSGYRYFWSTGDSLSAIVVKRTGLFSLDSLVNAQGCGHKLGDTVAISIKNAVVPEVPVISGLGKVEICEGEKAQLSVDSVQLAVKYNWSNGIEGDSIQVGGGQYSVISVSAEGCQSGPSDSVSVVEIPNPKPVFMNVDSVLTRETLSNQNYCAQGQEGSRFSFSVTGGEKVDSSENCITVKWNKLTVGSGQLTVRETTANPKCDGLVSQNFIYQPNLQIPNLVTPNGDGKNDVFKIEDLEFYASYQLQIFDRWGKKVLESSDYKNDWEGDAGIYFYSLVVEGKEFKGWVMVE